MSKKFRISVITPVYNAEAYLDETIGSVLGQSIGFRDNIQLILVDDGSSDSSKEICERYRDEYPDNVVYVEKENGGVSSARNAGLEKVAGKYIVFLDSDDRWDADAFTKIYDFFEAHPDSFNVVSCRIRFFGDYEGREHPLDYKFEKGARIVDLEEEPDIISSTIGNAIVKADAVGDVRFNEKISAGEDSLFVNSILLNDPHIGILPEAVFYYRRNNYKGSGSSSAPNRVSWYTQVPEEYYLGLCRRALEKNKTVPPFIQYVIMYDLRWRSYNPHMMEVLSEEEKAKHIAIMKEVMSNIAGRTIRKAKGLTQYRKLYLYQLKYGRDVIDKAEIKDHRLVHKKVKIFDFCIPTVVRISVFEVENGRVLIEGMSRLSAVGDDQRIIVRDSLGNQYTAVTEQYEKLDVHGYVGEEVVRGERFRVEAEVQSGMELSFYALTKGQEIQLKPSFDNYLSIRGDAASDYCYKGGFIIHYYEGRISFVRDSLKNRMLAEAAFRKEIKASGDTELEAVHEHELRMHKILTSAKTGKTVVFLSCRADDELRDNMKCVYDMTDLPKEYYSRLDLYRDYNETEKAAALVSSAKVIVTDDYFFLAENYRLRPDQHLVQLWHATGAFKHFGKDSGSLFPGRDRLYHRDYDLVTVSSEEIRQIYADCFQIPVDKVKATGVARTDELFDADYRSTVTAGVYEKHPELKGREIILYAPTFRDTSGAGRSQFTPDLDFRHLSRSLREDQIFVLCPHPVMTERIIRDELPNVIEIRDVTTAEMMMAADLLITDYSSVMFEWALMGKPIAFYCYDYDSYERDFYLDMDTELPGPILKEQEELHAFLREQHLPDAAGSEAGHPADDNVKSSKFFNKYLGACDGHSTERIVSLIRKLYHDEQI